MGHDNNQPIYPDVERQLTVSHQIIRLRQFNAVYYTYKLETGTTSTRMPTWKFRRSEHDHNHKTIVHRNHALYSLDYPGYIRSEYSKEILIGISGTFMTLDFSHRKYSSSGFSPH